MAESSSPRIACPNCGKQYKWKPSLAGRKTECTGCGQKMRLPRTPDQPVEPIGGLLSAQAHESHGAYELALSDSHVADEHLDPGAGRKGGKPASQTHVGRCPSCNSKLKPGAVICINCGFNVAQGKKIQTAVGQDAEAPAAAAPRAAGSPQSGFAAAAALGGHRVDTALPNEPGAIPESVRDVWLPLALVVVGFAVAVLQQMMFSDNPLAPLSAVVATVINLVLYVPLLLLALFIATKMLDLSFGSLWTGLLKLMAVILGPSTVIAIIGTTTAPMLGPLMGPLLGWVVSLFIYWALLQYLFRLTFNETFGLVIIILVVRIIAGYLIALVLLTILAGMMP